MLQWANKYDCLQPKVLCVVDSIKLNTLVNVNLIFQLVELVLKAIRRTKDDTRFFFSQRPNDCYFVSDSLYSLDLTSEIPHPQGNKGSWH